MAKNIETESESTPANQVAESMFTNSEHHSRQNHTLMSAIEEKTEVSVTESSMIS